MAPGRAFENAVHDAFSAMGFEARTISGSKDTDILVTWRSADGSPVTAIVEAKARSSGVVAHTDVSDVGLETHKGRPHASFGPAFSGDTIRDMAAMKKWVLLDADRLGQIADDAIALGLRPHETARLFLAPSGLSDLDDLIADRRRTLDIVSFLLTKLAEEQDETGEAISARDISRDGRRSELCPGVDEIVAAIDVVRTSQVDVLRVVETSDDPRFATYVLGAPTAGARWLRALADAIERPAGDAGGGDGADRLLSLVATIGAVSFLDRITPFLWLVVAVCTIGLASEVVGIAQQIPVQRGIDAHTVRLPGTFVELDKEGRFHDDRHIVSYAYADRGFRTPLRGLPGNPDVGAKVCVEIDATRPENMRPCDTLGGLGDSLAGLGWGSAFLVPALLALWSRNDFVVGWGIDWRGEFRRPERPHPSALRRKPTRRDRKRARKAEREAEDELFGR